MVICSMKTEQIRAYDSKYNGLYVVQDVMVPTKGIERFFRRFLGMDLWKSERYATLVYYLRGGHKPSLNMNYTDEGVVVSVDGKISPYYVCKKVKRHGRVPGR